MPDAVDLSNLPHFLEHLREREVRSAEFAQLLLDEGGTVVSFWGPEQMDVWELRIQRGAMIVRFGVERGLSDGVLIAPAEGPTGWTRLRQMRLAVFAWARANVIPLRLDDPDDLDIDLAACGIATLDWVGSGHGAEVDRVERAWRDYRERLGRLQSRSRGRPDEADLRAVKGEGLEAMEAASRSLL